MNSRAPDGKHHDPAGLLAAVAAERPEDAAVVDEGSTTTFGRFTEEIAVLARRLRAMGVGPGMLVGVAAGQSVLAVRAVWAVLSAGGAYLPLPMDYPDERLRVMLEVSRLKYLLVDPSQVGRFADLRAGDTCLVDLSDVPETGDRTTPPANPSPADPAYVIYTSGSTGRPKGVVVSRGAIAHQLGWLRTEFFSGGGQRLLCKTPIGFDAAQWELLGNACGATLVVATPGAHRDPGELVRLVTEHGVTMMQCVPTLWRALLREPTFGSCTTLTTLFSGGEPLPAALARDLMRSLPASTLVNLYGPTESTINITAHRVSGSELNATGMVSLGTVVDGCRVHVLDDGLRLVTPGSTGELCIEGPQLANGYLDDDDRDRFPVVDIGDGHGARRIYRTGDIGHVDERGLLHFHGRSDDQVKISGHRVETEEVRLSIERHPWVRAAAVVPWNDEASGSLRLAAYAELDPEEAALMDQDLAANHHRSKKSHHQVRAQLARLGARSWAHDSGQNVTPLPNVDGRPIQRTLAFSRKSYRMFAGPELDASTLAQWIKEWRSVPAPGTPQPVTGIAGLGDLLRWLGPFRSPQRLLPKYCYASPGALNATQVYVETRGVADVPDGMHYFDPDAHRLVQLRDLDPSPTPAVRIVLVGIRKAIESVYATNVDEVLHLEAGHMLGVLDLALAQRGCRLVPRPYPEPDFGLAEPYVYTGGWDVVPGAFGHSDGTTLTVQVHGRVAGLSRGTYDEHLRPLTDAVIERRHVIAINQRTYDASSFGVTVTRDVGEGLAGFIELGRSLQHLQTTDRDIGLMPSGYSSLSGRPLQAAVRYQDILGSAGELSSYFALGGPISREQREHEGMDEDRVHMLGPEELIKEDLRRTLPHYMVPARVEVLESLPVGPTGKTDRSTLIRRAELRTVSPTEAVPPDTPTERNVATIWEEVLGSPPRSVLEDFFAVGGDSLLAVRLMSRISAKMGVDLSFQTLFEAPTVRGIADGVERNSKSSRLVPLSAAMGPGVVMWPGLGGYPMNLRPLAQAIAATGHQVWGVQTRGLNTAEFVPANLAEIADEDAELVSHAISGPVIVVGYSFGAHVASEVAARLLAMGVDVTKVVLIAPGSPLIAGLRAPSPQDLPDYGDEYFRRILGSVFSGSTEIPYAADIENRRMFLTELQRRHPDLGATLVRRIVELVEATYGMRAQVTAPPEEVLARTHVAVAQGDGRSFIDSYQGTLSRDGRWVTLNLDHYEMLRPEHSAQVAAMVLGRKE